MTVIDPNVPKKPGLLRAMLDAIYGEDDSLAGVSVTRLTTPMLDTDDTINVETTLRFGTYTDGDDPAFAEPVPYGDAKLIIDGEIIYARFRTDTTFSILDRGLDGSGVRFHPQSTLVYDYSQNRSAVDAVRRAFMVRFAQGEDLDVIGRNLGVAKCRDVTDAQWREIIQRTAYMPKQPLDSFRQVLDVVLPGQYTLVKKPSEPWTVTVYVDLRQNQSKKGQFLLNGGEAQLSISATEVRTNYPIHQIISVTADTPLVRMGFPSPDLAPTKTFIGQQITLDANVGSAGVPLLVNYGAFAAHYLALDENTIEQDDFFAYLSDNGAGLVTCLLDHVRAAGIKIKVKIR